MNKRYIDFVPAKRKVASPPRKPVVKKTEAVSWADDSADAYSDVAISQMFAEKAPPAGVSTGLPRSSRRAPQNYQQKFVKTEVNKRPLSSRPAVSGGAQNAKMPVRAPKTASKGVYGMNRPGMAGANQRPVSGRPVASARPVAATPGKAAQGMAKLQPTRAKFLNTNKIEKRPLSKNVYTKSAASLERASKEEALKASSGDSKGLKGLMGSKGLKDSKSAAKAKKSEKPTVIIAKPEKDSKVGLVVAIVVTIVFGAAAGTVAFLLLPK